MGIYQSTYRKYISFLGITGSIQPLASWFCFQYPKPYRYLHINAIEELGVNPLLMNPIRSNGLFSNALIESTMVYDLLLCSYENRELVEWNCSYTVNQLGIDNRRVVVLRDLFDQFAFVHRMIHSSRSLDHDIYFSMLLELWCGYARSYLGDISVLNDPSILGGSIFPPVFILYDRFVSVSGYRSKILSCLGIRCNHLEIAFGESGLWERYREDRSYWSSFSVESLSLYKRIFGETEPYKIAHSRL
jgi:hypothetical protein